MMQNYDNAKCYIAFYTQMKIANDRCLVIDYNNPPRLQGTKLRKRASKSGLHKSYDLQHNFQ